MGEWKEYNLSEVGKLQRGKSKHRPRYAFHLYGGPYPFIQTGQIKAASKYITEYEQTYSEAGLAQSKIWNRGTLCITIAANIAEIAILSFDACFPDSIIGFIPDKNKCDLDFAFYTLKHFQKELQQMGDGSVQDNINIGTFEQIKFPFPPLSEQIQIASILSSLDDKIDLLHHQNKTLEQLAETLFRQWFEEEAEESWEQKKLGELLTVTSSRRIFYSEYVSTGIPFYRSKEIIELRIMGSTNSELCISKARFDEISKKFGSPKEGDILMTSVGTLGVAYRVKKSDKFYFKDGNLTWFKDFKELPSSIIYLWLISKVGQEKLKAVTIGSTQEALTIDGLKSISFKIPPKGKIDAYEKDFKTIINRMEFNQTQILTLIKLRDTLLPRLMNGEVRVKQIQ